MGKGRLALFSEEFVAAIGAESLEQCTILEVHPSDPCFNQFTEWVLDKLSFPPQNISLRVDRASTDIVQAMLNELEEAKNAGTTVNLDELFVHPKKVSTHPFFAYGVSSFQHQGHNVYLYVQPLDDPVAHCQGVFAYNHLALIVKGTGKVDVLKSVLHQVVKDRMDKELQAKETISMYRWSVQQNYWILEGTKHKRPLESVILPSALKNKLVGDFRNFLSKRALRFYVDHGIPYKRSYLLYGKPGTGKTSTISALASAFDRNVCFVQPGHPDITDDNLKTAMQQLPAKSVVVLEDIDAIFGKDRAATSDKSPLTFSGLLNALDGVGDPDGQIFFLTSNHPERLDSALIRPGRVDVRLEFSHAVPEQLKAMFLSFFPNDEAQADLFVTKVGEKFPQGVSPAALQQHFIICMDCSAEECVKNVANMEGDYVPPVEEKKEEVKKDAAEVKKDAAEVKVDAEPKPAQ